MHGNPERTSSDPARYEERSSSQELVMRYREFVVFVAKKLVRNLGLPADLLDEFVSAGYLGLVEAAQRYEPSSGVHFKHFAYLRVRGAIIDCIRDCADLRRTAYRASRALKAAEDLREHYLETNGAREPDAAKVIEYAARAGMAIRLSLQDLDPEDPLLLSGAPGAEQLLEEEQERRRMRELVASLPEKLRHVIEAYYFKGKSFVEIAKSQGDMSKSWVSRLHARALDEIRTRYTGETTGAEPSVNEETDALEAPSPRRIRRRRPRGASRQRSARDDGKEVHP